MKILSNKFYFLIVALFVFANLANAQDGPPEPPGIETPVVPIDGLLTVFIIVAVVFGIYMIYRNIKNQTPLGN
ncbi:MAG: hypothetical protein I4O51_03355 [Flavobacterium micromati]|nr:hypothetical protein [Flavobacterium micromati]